MYHYHLTLTLYSPAKVPFIDLFDSQLPHLSASDYLAEYPQKSPTVYPDFRFGAVMIEGRGPMGVIQNINLGYGILHLYRDPTEIKPFDTLPEAPIAMDSTILCTLAVPSYMATSDFLQFVAPVDPYVSHYRIVRDSSPNRYMVVMKFRDPKAAQDYYKQYNGRAFNSMEPEICHVVYLKSVEINSVLIPPHTFPFLHDTLAHESQKDQDDLDKIELPTCPVCLERMDDTVTGLLTILCQHTFHCSCLSKWGDSSCPVCRYSQKPVLGMDVTVGSAEAQVSLDEDNTCMVCGSNESLWICLICGHVGCGRYQDAHAYDHYTDTGHLYALEIETQRVWDYVGDGYVHRLIQNMIDGKIVELPSATAGPTPRQTEQSQDKLEAMSVEYTHLLTSQLDSQRIYYEDHLDQVTSQLSCLTLQVKGLITDMQAMQQEKEQQAQCALEATRALVEARKDKDRAERKLEGFREKLEVAKREWREEKEMTNSLLQNNALLKADLEQNRQSVKELTDQVRDLMFFLEARDKVQQDPDMGGGSLSTRVRKGTNKNKQTKQV
ncbi:BRCA1-associated protein 2-domain-containing protein [Phycomyces nitens]|nr:BRCA1-associated protein 2-domain-containing protein [Phycomyces nitens]